MPVTLYCVVRVLPPALLSTSLPGTAADTLSEHCASWARGMSDEPEKDSPTWEIGVVMTTVKGPPTKAVAPMEWFEHSSISNDATSARTMFLPIRGLKAMRASFDPSVQMFRKCP